MSEQTYEDYIKELEDNGYINQKGVPLKCQLCNGTDLEKRHLYFDERGCVEYQIWCVPCNERLGIWAYGNWDL